MTKAPKMRNAIKKIYKIKSYAMNCYLALYYENKFAKNLLFYDS